MIVAGITGKSIRYSVQAEGTRYREVNVPKIASLFEKLNSKTLKNRHCTYNRTEILALKENIETELSRDKLSSYKRQCRLKTLEIIAMLEHYYVNKNGKVPPPAYLFYEKCPELLPFYMESSLPKLWFCGDRDRIGSLSAELTSLEQFNRVEAEPKTTADNAEEKQRKLKELIEKHINDLDALIDKNKTSPLTEAITTHCNNFTTDIRNIVNKKTFFVYRIRDLKQKTQETKKLLKKDRTAWSVLGEWFINFLAILSATTLVGAVGLVYLENTKNTRGSFWYETKKNRSTYRIVDNLSEMEDKLTDNEKSKPRYY